MTFAWSGRPWRLILIILALVWLTHTHAYAQEGDGWLKGDGPVAFVTHIAVDPSDPEFLLVFVANSTHRNPDQTQTLQGQALESWAPYFSLDGGATWQPASNDLAEVKPTFLEMFLHGDQSVAWVGTETHGLWHSDNRGRTWRPARIPALINQKTLGLTQDARGRLHLLTIDRTRYPTWHLYTSRDGGNTWSHRQLQTDENRSNITDANILADPFDSNRLYITSTGGLLVSEDAGFSWKRVRLPLGEQEEAVGNVVMAADTTQRGRLFLVQLVKNPQNDRRLLSFRSLDGGMTWHAQPTILSFIPGVHTETTPTPITLNVDPRNRQHLLLGTDTGLWRSPDGGATWRLAGPQLAGVPICDVIIHPQQKGRWIAIGAGGLWTTETAGNPWRASVSGLPATGNIHDLIRLSGEREVILALNGGYLPADDLTHPLWRSVDGGQSWMPAMRGLEGVRLRQILAHPFLEDTAFALTDQGLARTDNGGLSWLQRPLEHYPLAMAVDPTAPRVYIGTGQGLLFSADKGDSWQQVFDQGSAVAVTVDAQGTVFLASYDEAGQLGLWRGQAEGASWAWMGALPVQGVVHLYAHPRQPQLLALTSPWEGLYVSVNGGKDWERRDDGIPAPTLWRGGAPEQPQAANILSLFMDAETGVWWASRDGGGVYRSTNNGAQWTDATGDIGDAIILSFTRGEAGLIAGAANGGVYRNQPNPTPPAPPAEVDLRIEIFWPHDFAPVTKAKLANLGLRLYRARSLEPPPCAWSPDISIWQAKDAEPLRKLGFADHRHVEGHPFPFWTMNDLDVTWANDPAHQLIYLAKITPGLADGYGSVWVHAADARTYLPDPPSPEGLAPAGVTEIDGRILVVWPHDARGRFAPPEEADLANISAVLFQRDTLLALREEDLPERVWLIGALDNQIGRRLAVGKPRTVEGDGFRYTVYDFNDIDVSLARDPAHRWAFWLEAPGADITSNVWIHGVDARTIAPKMTEPITTCRP